MEAQILRAMIEGVERRVEQGFDNMNIRMSEKNTRDSERHAENVSRLSAIEADVKACENNIGVVGQKVDRINGSVGRHDDQIKTLFTRRLPHTGAVTLSDIKWYLVCVLGGWGACMALLKLLGKL